MFLFNLIDESSKIQSVYSSELTANSPIYSRTSCQSFNYYQVIELNVIETSFYTITTNSTIDTYVFIYKNNFNIFNPKINLISQNDNVGCGNQFKITNHLQINTTYVLIVTTRDENVEGTFSVHVTGQNDVSFSLISEYF